jgi:hypothetical protein
MRIASLLLLALLFPLGTGAQVVSTEPVMISISPTHPRPYQTITVTIASNLLNLNASDLTISANGVIIAEQERSGTTKVGAAGSRTVLKATVVTPGKTYTKEVVVIPGDVALVMEPLTNVHPFYMGSPLVASEGRVRFVAIPDIRTAPGSRVSSDNLSYTWRLGDKILTAQSGIGKSSFVATAPQRYRDATISVTVTTRDQTIAARASVDVSPVDPIVRMYRSDPLAGTDYANALNGTYGLRGTEETFRAVSYFFKTIPSFEWTLNGNPSGSSDTVTVRASGNAGTAVLGTRASADTASASARSTIRFGEGRSTGIFGL